MSYEAVIGLEIHCQLATDTKIFCGCRARLPSDVSVADVAPNANTCPICAGHPGTLPVMNEKAVEYAVLAGLATGCSINRASVFARKNYFYPDLPKGYQISQYDQPICLGGSITIETKDGSKRIGITRIHLEEDAGKNVHQSGYSAVNLNRAGVPLIEIVSEPELRSAEEAGAYMRALYSIVMYLGITEGNLQEGNFRCDANVSVMPKGSKTFGTRTEIKNVNSFRFVEKAIEHEIARQISVVSAGGKIVQETRLYDPDKNATFTMRTKEEAHDYRYFPDPDLMTIRLAEAFVEKAKAALPELPEQKKARYVAELGLTPYDAQVITASKALAAFFEACVSEAGAPGASGAGVAPGASGAGVAPGASGAGVAPGASGAGVAKTVANFVTGEVARRMNDEGIEIGASKLKPSHVASLVKLVQGNVVSSTGAKKALGLAWETGEAIDAIVEREGLKQVSDLSAFEPVIDQIIAANPKAADDVRGGNAKSIGFFVGQAMKQTGGKANPALLQELIKKKILGG